MADDIVIEKSPDSKYCRFKTLLGSGAFKKVYKGVDTEEGIEIAWAIIELDRADVDVKQLRREREIISQLNHPNILRFYDSWIDEDKMQAVFITEFMVSGTLKQFLNKKKNPPRLRVIKNWSRQILEGLCYLHSQNPSVIHRDIKCDNIFLHQSSVKIGDLGLATNAQSQNMRALSVIGTPHFMAPEVYDEAYSTKADIWAFGMTTLEMVTNAFPYVECDSQMQIFKRVTQGVLPAALLRVNSSDVRDFVASCLTPVKLRPSAAELLQHAFFRPSDNEDNPVELLESPVSALPNVTLAGASQSDTTTDASSLSTDTEEEPSSLDQQQEQQEQQEQLQQQQQTVPQDHLSTPNSGHNSVGHSVGGSHTASEDDESTDELTSSDSEESDKQRPSRTSPTTKKSSRPGSAPDSPQQHQEDDDHQKEAEHQEHQEQHAQQQHQDDQQDTQGGAASSDETRSVPSLADPHARDSFFQQPTADEANVKETAATRSGQHPDSPTHSSGGGTTTTAPKERRRKKERTRSRTTPPVVEAVPTTSTNINVVLRGTTDDDVKFEKVIQVEYNQTTDTPERVAAAVVKMLDLPSAYLPKILKQIQAQVDMLRSPVVSRRRSERHPDRHSSTGATTSSKRSPSPTDGSGSTSSESGKPAKRDFHVPHRPHESASVPVTMLDEAELTQQRPELSDIFGGLVQTQVSPATASNDESKSKLPLMTMSPPPTAKPAAVKKLTNRPQRVMSQSDRSPRPSQRTITSAKSENLDSPRRRNTVATGRGLNTRIRPSVEQMPVNASDALQDRVKANLAELFSSSAPVSRNNSANHLDALLPSTSSIPIANDPSKSSSVPVKVPMAALPAGRPSSTPIVAQPVPSMQPVRQQQQQQQQQQQLQRQFQNSHSLSDPNMFVVGSAPAGIAPGGLTSGDEFGFLLGEGGSGRVAAPIPDVFAATTPLISSIPPRQDAAAVAGTNSTRSPTSKHRSISFDPFADEI